MFNAWKQFCALQSPRRNTLNLVYRRTHKLTPARGIFDEIESTLQDIEGNFDFTSNNAEIDSLDAKLKDVRFWSQEFQSALEYQVRQDSLRKSLHMPQSLRSTYKDLKDLADLSDLEMMQEVETEALSLCNRCNEYLASLWLSQPADVNSAVIEIHAGSGGTDACDWANMLARMYKKWANSHNHKVKIAEETAGDIAGVKSTTIIIEGLYVYGYTQYESGVHRLVRNSPFDKGGARHTSFASVQVSPYLDENKTELALNPSDLKITTMRSQGPGGQHVNKTESAIRIVHIPTGLTVAERSQHRSKAEALSLLKSKLFEMQRRKREQNKSNSYRTLAENAWGSQIRSYTLNPYQSVKDVRTGYQVGGPAAQEVLEGNISGFVNASLRMFRHQQHTGTRPTAN